MNDPLHLTLTPAAQARIAALGLEFQARFYGVEARRRPRNVVALAELGHVLTQLRRYEEGLLVDRQLARLAPENPTAHYNLGCSLALVGRLDEALDALEHAVELGYDDVEHMLADEDLVSLRGESRFRVLAARLTRTPA